MKTFFTSCCLLFLCVSLSGQDNSADADDLYKNSRYSEALPAYLKQFKTDSSDIVLNYRIAECYFNSRSQKLKAVSFLERAIYLSEVNHSNELPNNAYKMLADIYQQEYQFDKAIINYEKFKSVSDSVTSAKDLQEANWKIDMCKVGKALDGLTNKPSSTKKEQGKIHFNTIKSSGFSTSLSSDKERMSFTFKREDSDSDRKDDLRFYEKKEIILTSKDKTDSSGIKFEKRNFNETTVATSFDGQIVLYYRDENGSANLYATCLNGNTWTKPERINKPVNLSGWEENEWISPDGKVMYFVSDRKGGYGGKDIYVCRKQDDNEWGKAENLGPVINTPFDEEAPFIHPDGSTLYFSSNGKQKVGHYDIYLTRINGNTWSEPKMVSFPIDTTKDLQSSDTLPKQVVIQKKKKRSKKNISEIEKINQTRDNYLISFTNPYGDPLTLLKGEFILDETKESGNVKLIVRNNENKEINALYYTDKNSKKYSIILPPSKNNNIAYQKEGFMIFTENVDLSEKKDLYVKKSPLVLHAPSQGASIELNNIFFENEHSVLRPTSEVALNDLYEFLDEHKNLIVEFNSLIVAKENIRLNSKLSQERADVIVKYLISKGLSKDRLIAKGDAIKAKRAKDKKPGHFMELKVIDYLLEKELTTQ